MITMKMKMMIINGNDDNDDDDDKWHFYAVLGAYPLAKSGWINWYTL